MDYTLIDTRCLRATRTFDPPPLERLRESIALPSEYFPSDHIPVVVEVTYSDLDLGTWGPGDLGTWGPGDLDETKNSPQQDRLICFRLVHLYR